MVDEKLAADEAERVAHYEAIKSNVKSEVGEEIFAGTAGTTGHSAEVVDAANRMHRRAVDEVIDTESEIDRARATARISQVVDYIFFLIYGLLAVRLLLELFAARENAGFFKFIKTVTDPFYAPFRGLVPSPSTPEGFTLALPIVVAIVAYMLLHLAINGLLRIIAHRKTSV